MSLPSPTSTEPSDGYSVASATAGRGFRVRAISTIVLLSVIAAGLAIAATVRGSLPPPESPLELTLSYLSPGRDEVFEQSLEGEATSLYRGSDIRAFARLDEQTIVIAEGTEREMRLGLHAVDGSASQDLELPDVGSVGSLGVVGTVVLFTMTSADADPLPRYDRTLFRIDLAGDSRPQPVMGLDGEPVTAQSWVPIPNTPDVVVSETDGQLYRYAPLAGELLLPLGQHFPLHSVTIDGAAAVVEDAGGVKLLDLVSGAETRLIPADFEGIEPYLGATHVLPDGRRVAKIVVQYPDGSAEAKLVVDDGASSRELDVAGAPVASTGVDPTGRAVIVLIDSTQAGQEPTGPILVIDLDSGEVLLRVAGVDPSW